MKTIRERKTRLIVCIAGLLAFIGTAQAQQIDNAALLYYQAFLLYEKPDATMEQMLTDFRAGKIASNETIRDHFEKNRQVIEYVAKAASCPRCDWGYDYSLGFELSLATPPAIKRMASLVSSEAVLLAEQGDYPAAINRCMAAHRMALHTADKPLITYLMGIAVSGLTNRAVQRVLEPMQGDAQALNAFKTQLRQIQDVFPPLADALTQEGQICAMSMRKDKIQAMVRILEQDDDDFAESETRTRLLTGDEAFFERNQTYWFNSIATLAGMLRSGLPYSQTYAKIDEFVRQTTAESEDNLDTTLTAISLPAVNRVYMLETRLRTHFNAIQTAIELYVTKVQTGRLPDSLPANSPLDLFSGKPFEYEKTRDGFILRCREKEDSEKTEANQYEFKIGG